MGGVLHCFTESLEMAEAAMAMGFYISISGIATFKNASALQAVVKALPWSDCWLKPTLLSGTGSAPGRENEPAFVRDVAQFIADLRQIPLAELAEATSHNFFELFKLAKR